MAFAHKKAVFKGNLDELKVVKFKVAWGNESFEVDLWCIFEKSDQTNFNIKSKIV